ncbi:MAG: hypothetical protein GY778_13275 [bacterium]|nr:hypothetical protein [bacterium]
MSSPQRFIGLFAVVVLACPVLLQAQFPSETVLFNGPPIDDEATAQEMFRTPEFSGTTSSFILANSAGTFDNNAAFRASGWGMEGLASLEVILRWVDNSDPDAWVRITTFDGPERPNPALDVAGKVRFNLTNRSELFLGRFGLCLGIRETNTSEGQMRDGGTTGAIEWVGVDPTPNGVTAGADMIVDTTAHANDIQVYPVGKDLTTDGLPSGTAVIAPGPDGVLDTQVGDLVNDDQIRSGYFISAAGARRPIPRLTVPLENNHQEIEFDLTTGDVTHRWDHDNNAGTPYQETVYDGGIAAFTGDGILSTPGGRGTFEHLAVTNIDTDGATLIDFAIDELQFEATMADPVMPPSIVAPVTEDHTQVDVQCTVGASLAELWINGGSIGTAVPGGAGLASFTTPQLPTLVVGDVLQAKQTKDAATSDFSPPVIVYAAGTALAENFDGYASQQALEQIWTQDDPANERRVELATGSASSCQNFVASDHPTAPSVSRLYYSLGSVDGSDAEPLVVTYRFKHDSNNTNARARFELASSLSRVHGALGFAFTNGIGGAFADQYTSMTNSPAPIISGYASDYFGYDYALTGIDRVPGVWHKMQIEVKTGVVNFYIDDALANPVDPDTGVQLYPNGVPRVNNTAFKYIILGLGFSNNGPAMMYDDISVTFGSTPLPFGDPNPVESPTTVGPLFPDDTIVDLIDVDTNATLLTVYADGGEVGNAAGPFPSGSAAVTVTSLGDGQAVTATQTVGGTESCYSSTVIVAVPAPTVEPVLVPGQTQVAVSDLEENLASQVAVYKLLGEGSVQLLGVLSNPATDPASVLVPGLADGDTILAGQTIGGVEGPLSAGVVVAVPAPTTLGPLDVDDTMVTVTDVHSLAETVTVYVNNDTYAVDPLNQPTVDVIVPALQPGNAVRATQTIDGIEGPFSNAVLVANFVTVNEFCYDDSSTDNFTFVELYNDSDSPVDIGDSVIQIGDYVAGQTPPGVYYEVVIPTGTTIATHGFWTVGMTDVATLPGAVVDQIDNALVLGNGQNYVALRSPGGILLDAVGYETNKSNTFIPAEIATQIGIGIWGNTVVNDNWLASDGRFFDGLDTDNNGRDFGLLPATPGYSNIQPDLMPYFEDCDTLAVDDPVPSWYGTYELPRVIDPTLAGTYNPQPIPNSPNGGLAMLARDVPGGNCTFLAQLAVEDITLETYIYVAPVFTDTGFEETRVGVRGTSDGVHNFDFYNGSTGICWLLQRGTTWQTLLLLDENDGNDGVSGDPICATILGTVVIDTDPSLTGWQRLLLEIRGDSVLGIFGGTYGSFNDGFAFSGTHEAAGPGGVYVTHRESATGLVNMRPPTLDAFSLTEPIAITPAAIGWESCALHDPAGAEGPPTIWCANIVEAAPRGGPDPRTDTQIDPRFYGTGGTAQAFLEVVIALDGAAAGAVTVDAVCTDTSTHGATVTVSTDGIFVTATFDPPLPNTECCTMTLGGGASGSQVIKLLQGDVNGSGRVNATDKNLVKGKITSRTPPLAGDDFFYDINMSGRINATDKNLVKGRITGAQNELDQSAGCGLP